MNYILQISTGLLDENYYTPQEIIQKIETITSKISVTRVLFGWYKDKEFNKQIRDYLKSKNIQCIFKLPVFSEITDLEQEQAFVYHKILEDKTNHSFYKNDKFDFLCPSSKKNLDYILALFEKIDNGVNYDGVFLDRIRYPSPSLNQNSIYGCCCEECNKLYKNIDINSITNFNIKNRDGFIYQYEDNQLNQLMRIKRSIITEDIRYLSNHFKQKQKIVGIDTFYPVLADFVGQDLKSISEIVDFIKPMNYYKTFAPAGIPYELDGINRDCKRSLMGCYENEIESIDCSVETSKELMKMNPNCDITIGIDANNIDSICTSNPEYIQNHIKSLEKVGIKEVVLSWNIMLIDDELFDKIK